MAWRLSQYQELSPSAQSRCPNITKTRLIASSSPRLLNTRRNWLALMGDSRNTRSWLGCWCRVDCVGIGLRPYIILASLSPLQGEGNQAPSPLQGEGWDGGRNFASPLTTDLAPSQLPPHFALPLQGGGNQAPSPLQGEGWDGGRNFASPLTSDLAPSPLPPRFAYRSAPSLCVITALLVLRSHHNLFCGS